MKFKYKNISDQDLEIPYVGVVKAGEVIESEVEINNANLEKVASNNQSKSKTNKDEESI